MQITNTDNSKDVKQCTMALPHEWINPLQLKLFLETDHEHYFDQEEGFVDDHGDDETSGGLNRVKVSLWISLGMVYSCFWALFCLHFLYVS